VRFILVLAASSSLAYLFAQLLHVRVPLTLYSYVGWMFLCSSVAYLAKQKVEDTEKGWAIFFAVTMTPAAFLAMTLSVQFAKSLHVKHGARIFILSMLLLAAIFSLLRESLPEFFPIRIILAQGYCLCLAGIVSVVSLAVPGPILGVKLRAILGSYWCVMGVYSFCFASGIVRSRALFESIDGWFASAACVVFLGGLGLALSGSQPELGRQEIRGMHVQHSELAEEVR
jgi:hypothetical protein